MDECIRIYQMSTIIFYTFTLIFNWLNVILLKYIAFAACDRDLNLNIIVE